jgi:hypothetical protein
MYQPSFGSNLLARDEACFVAASIPHSSVARVGTRWSMV